MISLKIKRLKYERRCVSINLLVLYENKNTYSPRINSFTFKINRNLWNFIQTELITYAQNVGGEQIKWTNDAQCTCMLHPHCKPNAIKKHKQVNSQTRNNDKMLKIHFIRLLFYFSLFFFLLLSVLAACWCLAVLCSFL